MQRHKARFATHQTLPKAVEHAITVKDGDTLSFGEHQLEANVLPASEADSHLVLKAFKESSVFIGDLVNVDVPGAPFASLSAWLEQLTMIAQWAGDLTMYQGHGRAPDNCAYMDEQ